MDAQACRLALDTTSARRLGGGLIYDAITAHRCAQAGAFILLTWNVQDFVGVAPANLNVRNPLS